jgi:hypothetical protein
MANNNGGGSHDDYLNAPDTAGRPMAIVSLILVFLVIGALAFLLFAGGRWLYNEYVDGDETTQVVVDEQDSGAGQETEDSAGGADNGSGQPANGDNGTGTTDDTATTGGEEDAIAGGIETDEEAASGEQDAATSAVTGPATTEEVPDTGPGSLLAVFIGVSVLAAILHRKWLINKL